MRRRHPAGGRRAAERGSAYLFALLALLVLTVIGLSLVVVTQTEVQIGGAQKSAGRVLYGADAGLRIQFARHAAGQDPQYAVVLENAAPDGTPLLERVDMSPMTKLYAGPCSLCSINMGSDRKWAVNHVVNAKAQRLRNITDPCSEPPQAQKLLSMMFFVQPYGDSSASDAASESGGASSVPNPTTIGGAGTTCVDGIASDSVIY
jgi:hypothetical protein